MRLRLMVIALVLLCVGCANVRNEQVSQSNLDSAGKDVAKSKLSDADKTAFMAAVLRSSMGAGASIDGKTVGQIIDQEKQDEATEAARAHVQAELAAQARAKADAEEKALASAVTVVLYKTSYVPKDPNWAEGGGSPYEEMTFFFSAKNNSGKSVRAFEGTMRFEDTLGNKIQDIDIKATPSKDVPPQGTLDVSEKSNLFADLSQLKNTPLTRITKIWKPSKIVFSDGSSMTVDVAGDIENSPVP